MLGVERSMQETGLWVKRLQMQHHRAVNEGLAPLKMSIVQWDVLRHLEENPDASLHHLAQLTFQTDQSLGTLAARMIARGLIERVPAPGRAVRHRPTPEGGRLLAAGAVIVDRVLAESFAPLTRQQRLTFDSMLQQLVRPVGSGGDLR
jgi:DNA-binding MarR family transcriptional regulator